MSKRLDVVRVFLASPSDLSEERRAALDVLSRVNGVARTRGRLVDVMMWEQVLPQYGRAQGTIDALVDECDLFVGLLYEKWGTPTGEYSSGFLEEFVRARERLRQTGTPDIALFFKTPSDGTLTALSPDLRQIIAFKETITGELLYTEIVTVEDWFRELTLLLMSVATGKAAPSDEEAVGRLAHEVTGGGHPSGLEGLKTTIAAGVNGLGDKEKIVLSLYYYEGLTLAEIGQVLGVTERAARRIHGQALIRLSKRVSGQS